MRQADVSPACSRTPRRGVRRRFLTGCQHTNLCDEVNFVDRHVAALKIGVPSPPVARDLELDVNVGNVASFASATAFRFRENASGSRHI